MLIRPVMLDQGIQRMWYDGDMLDTRETESALTTAGSGSVTAAMLSLPVLRRSGPAGGFTDTFDSAQNIITALAGNSQAAGPSSPGFMPVAPTVQFSTLFIPVGYPQQGASYRWLYLNTVAQAMTAAVTTNTGVTLGSNVNVAASLWREYRITLNNTTFSQTDGAVGFSNVNATITGVDASIIQLLTVGMTVASAGNVTAGTTITAINVIAGTVTMSANGLAVATAAVNFLPTVTIAGLRSGTA